MAASSDSTAIGTFFSLIKLARFRFLIGSGTVRVMMVKLGQE